ncbi:MAG: hypothetical protein GY871_03990 [Actinomycetales bacterium]|nr:hypothetical protein [Actinomycetales bacterium]
MSAAKPLTDEDRADLRSAVEALRRDYQAAWDRGDDPADFTSEIVVLSVGYVDVHIDGYATAHGREIWCESGVWE